jgi:protein-L-isoaspartate(D-aspartate) O-methyltransferase
MLAEKERAFSGWRQVQVSNTDGALSAFDQVDVIIASVGATHPLPSWVNAPHAGWRKTTPGSTRLGPYAFGAVGRLRD